jgi:flagellar biosynthesis protein FlhG
MANPAHWMKLKIMRHVRALPADFIIIDLGAGVHFNTLDFFSLSDRGIVVTAPEPGAVMNAYSFIKGALYRDLQNVFKKHPRIGPIIETETKRTDPEKRFTLEWLSEQIRESDPDMLPIIQEVEEQFRPALIVNKIREGRRHVLVRNLISLCSDKLGVTVEHVGDLPDLPEITNYLLNIPKFLETSDGTPYQTAIRKIADGLLQEHGSAKKEAAIKSAFSDDEIEKIISLMDQLDDSVFGDTSRDSWKLRMYFKPSEVVGFLTDRGVTHEAFYLVN